ncbi:hypothetical protein ACSSS7_008099 [Eimeria intestinalis]
MRGIFFSTVQKRVPQQHKPCPCLDPDNTPVKDTQKVLPAAAAGAAAAAGEAVGIEETAAISSGSGGVVADHQRYMRALQRAAPAPVAAAGAAEAGAGAAAGAAGAAA